MKKKITNAFPNCCSFLILFLNHLQIIVAYSTNLSCLSKAQASTLISLAGNIIIFFVLFWFLREKRHLFTTMACSWHCSVSKTKYCVWQFFLKRFHGWKIFLNWNFIRRACLKRCFHFPRSWEYSNVASWICCIVKCGRGGS